MERIKTLYQAMTNSDYILLGAGAGLSAAAGISFADEKAFKAQFPVLWQKGIHSDYQTFSYKAWSLEQRWAYWAKHITQVRYNTPPLTLYTQLLTLLNGWDYQIITSNVDRQFYRSGFPMERVFEAQGSYDWLRCTNENCDRQWAAEDFIKRMLPQVDEAQLTIPTDYLPRCPVCGALLEMAFRHHDGYHEAQENYRQWLKKSESGSICIIEIGVGFNSPGVIRVPFERITGERVQAKFFRITVDYPDSEEEIAYPEIPQPIAKQSTSLNLDARVVIETLFKWKTS